MLIKFYYNIAKEFHTLFFRTLRIFLMHFEESIQKTNSNFQMLGYIKKTTPTLYP